MIMKFEKLIDKIKYPEGREEVAKLMCQHTRCIDYEKTLQSLQYLTLPILLILEEKIDEITPICADCQILMGLSTNYVNDERIEFKCKKCDSRRVVLRPQKINGSE